ncbi:hypothetical protein KI387_024385, partial [Taxus chinensis]
VLLLIYFMLKYAMEMVISESSVITTYYFNWTTSTVAMFLALLGLTVLPVNLIIGNYIGNMFEERQLIIAAEILTCVGILISFKYPTHYSVAQYITGAFVTFISAEVLEGVSFIEREREREKTKKKKKKNERVIEMERVVDGTRNQRVKEGCFTKENEILSMSNTLHISSKSEELSRSAPVLKKSGQVRRKRIIQTKIDNAMVKKDEKESTTESCITSKFTDTGDTDLGSKPLTKLIDKSRAGKNSLMRVGETSLMYTVQVHVSIADETIQMFSNPSLSSFLQNSDLLDEFDLSNFMFEDEDNQDKQNYNPENTIVDEFKSMPQLEKGKIIYFSDVEELNLPCGSMNEGKEEHTGKTKSNSKFDGDDVIDNFLLSIGESNIVDEPMMKEGFMLNEVIDSEGQSKEEFLDEQYILNICSGSTLETKINPKELHVTEELLVAKEENGNEEDITFVPFIHKEDHLFVNGK